MLHTSNPQIQLQIHINSKAVYEVNVQPTLLKENNCLYVIRFTSTHLDTRECCSSSGCASRSRKSAILLKRDAEYCAWYNAHHDSFLDLLQTA